MLLARQYRFPIDRWIYDLPGGAGTPGEEPEDAARQECQEELGAVVKKLTHLQTFFSKPGRTAWPNHLFFACDLSHGTVDTSDVSEAVHPVTIDVAQVDRLVARGDVVDPGLFIAWTPARSRGLLVDA